MQSQFENKYKNTVAFYDAIAEGYNKTLEGDHSSREVRRIVADYFIKTVKGKVVLDFGGGTGLDLPWLLENNYRICFCEPSANMRNHAIEFCKPAMAEKRIRFLDNGEVDFRNWRATTSKQKFDAVLANFAVINSIEQTDILFEKLVEILKPGGHIIATMLDTTVMGILKYRKRNFMNALLKGEAAVLVTMENNYEHVSYLHTPGKIKQSARQFICRNIQPLYGFGFMLVHLQLNQ